MRSYLNAVQACLKGFLSLAIVYEPMREREERGSRVATL
jgi:hypothetical protein